MNSSQKESNAPSTSRSQIPELAPPPDTQAQPRKPLSGLHILVVEDEVIIAMDIQANLEDGGADVVGPAHTVASAFHHAQGAKLAAAVLDLRLGRDCVLPIAYLLRERGVPFLFYTGQTAADALLCDWPKAALLAKPATARQLIAAILALPPKVPEA